MTQEIWSKLKLWAEKIANTLEISLAVMMNGNHRLALFEPRFVAAQGKHMAAWKFLAEKLS